eukprot:1193558-Pleurochrysis_carterae.AAC.2
MPRRAMVSTDACASKGNRLRDTALLRARNLYWATQASIMHCHAQPDSTQALSQESATVHDALIRAAAFAPQNCQKRCDHNCRYDYGRNACPDCREAEASMCCPLNSMKPAPSHSRSSCASLRQRVRTVECMDSAVKCMDS